MSWVAIRSEHAMYYATIPFMRGQEKETLPRSMHASWTNRIVFTKGIEDATAIRYHMSFAQAFGDWERVDQGNTDRERASWLCGQLWNCTEILPAEYCDALGIPAGSTYARAARFVKRRILNWRLQRATNLRRRSWGDNAGPSEGATLSWGNSCLWNNPGVKRHEF
jgi:hypothetical protein